MPKQRKRLKGRRLKAEIAERSYMQWALLRTMAFGERDWLIVCAILFLLDSGREFFSIAGFSVWLMGVFFVGPIFGMALFMSKKVVMIYVKAKRKVEFLPIPLMKKQTWMVNAFWFPIFFFVSYHAFDLFYETCESLSLWSSANEG